MNKLREAARLYWMVKGHIPDWLHDEIDTELEVIINSYTKRMWNNNEAYLHEEGFEEAWEEFNEHHKTGRHT